MSSEKGEAAGVEGRSPEPHLDSTYTQIGGETPGPEGELGTEEGGRHPKQGLGTCKGPGA